MPKICRSFSKYIEKCICKSIEGTDTPPGVVGFPYVFPYVFQSDGIDPPDPPIKQRVQINISNNEGVPEWNSINIMGLPTSSFPLSFPDGTDSGMTFVVLTEGKLEGVESIEDSLVLDPDPDFPKEVYKDYFYMSNVDPKIMRINGAKPGKEYSFVFAFVPHASDFGLMDINYDVNGVVKNSKPDEEKLIKTSLTAVATTMGELIIKLDVYSEEWNIYSMVGAILVEWDKEIV